MTRQAIMMVILSVKHSGRGAARLARSVWVRKVVGSNPAAPTKKGTLISPFLGEYGVVVAHDPSKVLAWVRVPLLAQLTDDSQSSFFI